MIAKGGQFAICEASRGKRRDLHYQAAMLSNDLAPLMRRTSKHPVGNASVFQRKHSPYVGNQFPAVKQLCDRQAGHKSSCGRRSPSQGREMVC